MYMRINAINEMIEKSKILNVLKNLIKFKSQSRFLNFVLTNRTRNLRRTEFVMGNSMIREFR